MAIESITDIQAAVLRARHANAQQALAALQERYEQLVEQSASVAGQAGAFSALTPEQQSNWHSGFQDIQTQMSAMDAQLQTMKRLVAGYEICLKIETGAELNEVEWGG